MDEPDFERVYQLRRYAADERNMGHMIMAHWSEEDAIELAEDTANEYLDYLGDDFEKAREFVENMPPLVQWLYDRLMKRIDDAEALLNGVPARVVLPNPELAYRVIMARSEQLKGE